MHLVGGKIPRRDWQSEKRDLLFLYKLFILKILDNETLLRGRI